MLPKKIGADLEGPPLILIFKTGTYSSQTFFVVNEYSSSSKLNSLVN